MPKMREVNCLNIAFGGNRCKILKVDQCPKDCFAKVTDPVKYISMLEDLIRVNFDTNKQLVADYRREIQELKERFNLEDQDEPVEGDPYDGWKRDYYDSLKRRPGGGGGGEKDTNPSKPRTKCNKVQETKLTQAQRERIKELTLKWEKENEQLERLSRSPLTRNKTDSYTGDPIE